MTPPKLQTYKVRGWEQVDGARQPMRLLAIKAPTGEIAAWLYAREVGIYPHEWWGVSSKPQFVIRVAAEGEQAP